jgi:hypothetical protein
MFQNRFDEFYLTICKEVGGIEGLLKSFFDFMIRKTDFFYECDPGDKMGFPPGYNKKLVIYFSYTAIRNLRGIPITTLQTLP